MIFDFILSFLPHILGALAIVAAFFGYGQAKKTQGKREAETKLQEKDHERAEDIRNRVERKLPDRMRDYDDAGYRD